MGTLADEVRASWFEVPGRTAPAPPRWKMFVVTSVVIFVLQLLLNLILHRVASPIALVPRVALDFVLGVGVDDVARPAATCTSAGRLVVRASAIPLTDC
jgi:hypothetical protein